jgi:DNA-binding transcriptional LysR family regulator
MDAPPVAMHYVELRLLRYVIGVAEELHFGRAAKRLNVSAPSLSKQLKDLEHVLGYPLFERKTREVSLTRAGVAFVTEARQALGHVERGIERGYAASRGDLGALSVGYSPWFRPSLLVPLQSEFAARVPGTRLMLQSAYFTTQIELLLKGTLDAGIIELPTNVSELETLRVWHDELVAALPENHPLASRSEIDRHDLAEEPIIWIARALHPLLHKYFLESYQCLGYVPRIVHEINTLSELLDLVGAGAGVGFVKMSIVERVRQLGVVFRPLTAPKLLIDTGVAYRSDNRSAAVQSLLQLLREQST